MIGRLRRSAVRLVKQHLGRRFPNRIGPGRYRSLVSRYRVADLVERDGRVPLVWWTVAVNFGDLMSPWLIEKMTGRPVVLATEDEPNYVAIGSVLRRVTDRSVVWGTGSFGTEPGSQVNRAARYRAVRGPLTRAKLLHHKVKCPEIYGDPALLAPLYYLPKVRRTHEFGLVVRWSERDWAEAVVGPGVRIIDYLSGDIEGTIRQMLSCRRIISSSLHGLIVADAYGIPNAWLASDTPKGGEFKFHDYFASVKKHRYPQRFDPAAQPVTAEVLRSTFVFSGEPIDFNYRTLLDACPFLSRIPAAERAPMRRAAVEG